MKKLSRSEEEEKSNTVIKEKDIEDDTAYSTLQSSSGGSSCPPVEYKHSTKSSSSGSQAFKLNKSTESQSKEFCLGNKLTIYILALETLKNKYENSEVRLAKSIQQLTESFLQIEKLHPNLGIQVNC